MFFDKQITHKIKHQKKESHIPISLRLYVKTNQCPATYASKTTETQ